MFDTGTVRYSGVCTHPFYSFDGHDLEVVTDRSSLITLPNHVAVERGLPLDATAVDRLLSDLVV